MYWLEVSADLGGIDVYAPFKQGVTTLDGFSGSGKSLLMEVVDLYCREKGISNAFVNYRMSNRDKEAIIQYCKNVDVILLDNADLYLSKDMLDIFRKTGKVIIISIKEPRGLGIADDTHYIVKYSDMKVRVREV